MTVPSDLCRSGTPSDTPRAKACDRALQVGESHKTRPPRCPIAAPLLGHRRPHNTIGHMPPEGLAMDRSAIHMRLADCESDCESQPSRGTLDDDASQVTVLRCGVLATDRAPAIL